LAEFVKGWNEAKLGVGMKCKFIFVDLCRPLTSVRYTKRLRGAEAKVRALLGSKKYVPVARPELGDLTLAQQGGVFQASHTLNEAIRGD
jgi:hypothetical protein